MASRSFLKVSVKDRVAPSGPPTKKHRGSRAAPTGTQPDLKNYFTAKMNLNLDAASPATPDVAA